MHRIPSTMALVCLEATGRLKSFTAAGRELHLTQGAVSRQVANLEERVGTALLVRKRDAVEPTEAGRYYLAEISPLLQRLDRATAHVALHKGRGGELALSVPSSLASHWLIPRLPRFTFAHPEIALNLTTRIGPVDFGRTPVDAAVEFSDGERRDFQSEFLMPLVLSPYAAPAWIARHGRTLDAATPASALIHLGTVQEAWREWFKAAGIERSPGPEGPRYELMSMALTAAVAGLGVVLLPAFMVTEALAAGQLRRLSRREWRATRAYHLVYASQPIEQQPLQAFREWLLAEGRDAG
jgi:DNA-binding transcriptional LysR family regulator